MKLSSLNHQYFALNLKIVNFASLFELQQRKGEEIMSLGS